MSNRGKIQAEADRLRLARQIRSAGVPVFIAEDDRRAPDPPIGLLVYQTRGVVESTLFDFYGGTGLILQAAVTINMPGFSIARFDLELPWPSQIMWLPDPLERDGVSTEYRFGPDHKLVFPRDDVLNHYADVHRMFRQGQSLTGLLLGIGAEPIADRFQHGAMVPAFLIVYDQFWHPYRCSVSFWADRSEVQGKPWRSRIGRMKRLFDCPDKRSDRAAKQ